MPHQASIASGGVRYVRGRRRTFDTLHGVGPSLWFENLGQVWGKLAHELAAGTRGLPLPRWLHRPIAKTTRILTPFAVEANRVWRGAGWPDTESEVQGFLLSLFGRLGTFRIGNGLTAWHGLSAGLHHAPSGEARIGLWVWMNPRRVRERRNVLDAAATITPGGEWHAAEGEWEVVGAYRPVSDFATHGEATEWLVAKYVQLRDAGLLELLGKMRTTP